VVAHRPPASGQALELSERHEIPEFGFSIAYPAGWFAKTLIPVTIINELPADHDTAFDEQQPVAAGYEVTIEHRDMDFMVQLGLVEGATLQELLAFNKNFFPWLEPIEVIESQAFGEPALAVRAADRSAWGYTMMGFVNGQTFLLGFSAPSEESLDAFMPTWQRMVAGIELTEE
jgi:hypothetical protein